MLLAAEALRALVLIRADSDILFLVVSTYWSLNGPSIYMFGMSGICSTDFIGAK